MRMSQAQMKGLVARGMVSPGDLAVVEKAAAATKASRGKGRGGKADYPVAHGPFCPLDGHMPQEILWRGVLTRWPLAGEFAPAWEHVAPVPGKAGPPYRIDIAFPGLRLAIEMDGWEHHGKFHSDFVRDRRRERRLAVDGGWRFLRYPAGEVRRDLPAVLDEIELAIGNLVQGSEG